MVTETIKKGVSALKQKSEHHHWILHIRISLDTKFQPKLTILIFWTKFAQKGFSQSENGKSQHHHWILYIRINLGAKFQLYLTISIFWTKFAQNGRFQSKTGKVNITNELCMFKLVLVPNFSLIWQFRFFGQNLPKKGVSSQNQ